MVYDLGHPTRNLMQPSLRTAVISSFHPGRLRNQRALLRLAHSGRAVPKGKVEKLLDAWDALYTFVGNDGPVFYVKTTLDAPRSRVVAIDVRKPARSEWKTVIPESAKPLDQVTYVGGKLIAQYLKDAKSLAKVFDANGTLVREVALPGIGTVFGFAGHPDKAEIFYAFTSFTTPTAIYRYNVNTGTSELFRRAKVAADLDAYEVRQVFYKSKDGTRVPMFLVTRRASCHTGTRRRSFMATADLTSR